MNSNYDALRLAVEGSQPNNTVLYDDMGSPSFMVRIPKFMISDVIPGGTDATHPAFIINDVEVPEIFIAKYEATVENDRAYSLPDKDPRTFVSFDQAKSYCGNKGKGWHLMSNAEWAAVSLWCLKNDFLPRGNTCYGKSHSYVHENGRVTYTYGDPVLSGRVATGSGPVSWAHDNSPAGIFNLCGNVWEWVSGARLLDGEIQVIANNDSAAGADDSTDSALWKAIMSDGSLAAPGTEGTLKYDASFADGHGPAILSTAVSNIGTDATSMHNTFESLSAQNGVNVPEILKTLGLFPNNTSFGRHEGAGFWARHNGERMAFRSGYWGNMSGAGVFALAMSNVRSISIDHLGFRVAYVEL